MESGTEEKKVALKYFCNVLLLSDYNRSAYTLFLVKRKKENVYALFVIGY